MSGGRRRHDIATMITIIIIIIYHAHVSNSTHHIIQTCRPYIHIHIK